MFNKLRRRMVAFVSVVSGLILLLILVLHCVVNYVQIANSNYEMLQIYASSIAPDNLFDSEISEDKSNLPEFFASNFLKIRVWYNEGSLVVEKDKSVSFNITDEDLYKIATLAMLSEQTFGQIGKYNLRFFKGRTDSLGKVVVTFCSQEMEDRYMRKIIGVSSLTFVGGMIILVIIAVFVSKWLIKPTENAWRQQQQFIANASHELKTPLSVIMANNNILLSQIDGKLSDNEQWLHSTQAESEQMKILLDQMLYLAKSDAKMIRSEKTTIDLSELTLSCSLSFDSLAFEKGLLIDTEVDKDVYIIGNEIELKNVLFVLIDNAIKYSEKNKNVLVSLKKHKNKAELSVKSYGEPIPDKDLPMIFDRFYRVDQSRNKTIGGFGLGLSIAKSVVDEYKGTIKCESGDNGQTVFTVVLPSVEHKQ